MNVVYFVQARDGGPIKIGIAANLESRLAGLQNSCPVPLVCLATMPGYSVEEDALHSNFAASRLHGEWFEPSPELLSLIESLSPGEGSHTEAQPSKSRTPARANYWRRFVRLRADLREREDRLRQSIVEKQKELHLAKKQLREVTRELHAIQKQREVLRSRRTCSTCANTLTPEDDACPTCDYCRMCGVQMPDRRWSACATCRSTMGGLEAYARLLVAKVTDLAAWSTADAAHRLADRSLKAARTRSMDRGIESVRLAVECVDALLDEQVARDREIHPVVLT